MNSITNIPNPSLAKEYKLSTTFQIFNEGGAYKNDEHLVAIKTTCKLLKTKVESLGFVEFSSHQSMEGNPSLFSKILHFVLFTTNSFYLYKKGVDPQTVNLSDQKFMERVLFIISNILELKSRMTPK